MAQRRHALVRAELVLAASLSPAHQRRRARASHRLESTTLTDEQANYIGVPKNGPYKSDSYRY